MLITKLTELIDNLKYLFNIGAITPIPLEGNPFLYIKPELIPDNIPAKIVINKISL